MRLVIPTRALHIVKVQQLASRKGGKAVKKGDLPSKTCVCCGRPFTWRKKWESCWEKSQARLLVALQTTTAECSILLTALAYQQVLQRPVPQPEQTRASAHRCSRLAVVFPQLGYTGCDLAWKSPQLHDMPSTTGDAIQAWCSTVTI